MRHLIFYMIYMKNNINIKIITLALSFLHELGRRIKLKTHEPRSTQFLMQRIGIAIQRGNAASVMKAVPTSRDLEEVFYCFLN